MQSLTYTYKRTLSILLENIETQVSDMHALFHHLEESFSFFLHQQKNLLDYKSH